MGWRRDFLRPLGVVGRGRSAKSKLRVDSHFRKVDGFFGRPNHDAIFFDDNLVDRRTNRSCLGRDSRFPAFAAVVALRSPPAGVGSQRKRRRWQRASTLVAVFGTAVAPGDEVESQCAHACGWSVIGAACGRAIFGYERGCVIWLDHGKNNQLEIKARYTIVTTPSCSSCLIRSGS